MQLLSCCASIFQQQQCRHDQVVVMYNRRDVALCKHCWSSPETQAPRFEYMVVTFTTDSRRLLSGLGLTSADQCNKTAAAYKMELEALGGATRPLDCARASASAQLIRCNSFGHGQHCCVKYLDNTGASFQRVHSTTINLKGLVCLQGSQNVALLVEMLWVLLWKEVSQHLKHLCTCLLSLGTSKSCQAVHGTP